MSLYSEFQQKLENRDYNFKRNSSRFNPISENGYSLKEGFNFSRFKGKTNDDIFRSL